MPKIITALTHNTKFKTYQNSTHKYQSTYGCKEVSLSVQQQQDSMVETAFPSWHPHQAFIQLLLLLNPDTGTITPQFHIILDNLFSTNATRIKDLHDFTSAEWAQMFSDSIYQFVESDEDHSPAVHVDPSNEVASHAHASH